MSNAGLFPSGSTRVNSWGVDLYQVHQILIHLSSSSNDIVFIVIDGDVFILYCLFLLGNMDVGDGVVDCKGVSNFSVGVSIEQNSSFIFSLASNSSVALSLSFQYQGCKCIRKHAVLEFNYQQSTDNNLSFLKTTRKSTIPKELPFNLDWKVV